MEACIQSSTIPIWNKSTSISTRTTLHKHHLLEGSLSAHPSKREAHPISALFATARCHGLWHTMHGDQNHSHHSDTWALSGLFCNHICHTWHQCMVPKPSITNISSCLYNISNFVFFKYNKLCGINYLLVDNGAFVCCLCHWVCNGNIFEIFDIEV